MNLPIRRLLLAAAGVCGLSLAGCERDFRPPTGPGTRNVCYQVVLHKSGAPTYNVAAKDQPRIESCAAVLDAARRRFLAYGSNRTSMIGAYNGYYMFIDSSGMSTAESLNGFRTVAFARTGNGQLAIPSYIRYPDQPEPPPEQSPGSAPASK
jgi:hypothetical protein